MSDIPGPPNLTKDPATKPWAKARARPIDVTYLRWTGNNSDEAAQFLGSSYDGVAEIRGEPFLSFHDQEPGGITLVAPGRVLVLADGHLRTFSAAEFDRFYDTDMAATGADIEIIERDRGQGDPSIVVPDEIRINGRPVLAPADEPVRVHAEVPVSSEISTVWEDHAADTTAPVRRVQAIVHGSTLCDSIADALRKLADALET